MKCNLENIQNIFKQISIEGWNTHKELKWGHFFFNRNKVNLEKLANNLIKDGFQVEENGIIEIKSGNYRLWVSKREKLTPEKLHARNLKFNDLAISMKIDLYDGWDVGE